VSTEPNQNKILQRHTIWVSHLLHSSGGNHDRHGDLESQHGGGHVDLGHVDQYAWTEPNQNQISQQISNYAALKPYMFGRRKRKSDIQYMNDKKFKSADSMRTD